MVEHNKNIATNRRREAIRVIVLCIVFCLGVITNEYTGLKPYGISRFTTSINDETVLNKESKLDNDEGIFAKINAPLRNIKNSLKKSGKERIFIKELARTNHRSRSSSCPPGLTQMTDVFRPPSITHDDNKIPKIIHVTGRSRCVSQDFALNLMSWRSDKFKDYSFVFHDDDAVNRLLNEDWSEEFPGLKDSLHCLTHGATKADLWRYLVLWEYGGIYTDIDASPMGFNEDTIRPTDDSFLTVDDAGDLSQYFMASSRRHPLMNFTLHNAIDALRKTTNVMNNQAPLTTGSRALKDGFVLFMQSPHNNTSSHTSTGYESEGTYFGYQNRSVTIRGNKENPHEYVRNDRIRGKAKQRGYSMMNMSHYSESANLKAYDIQGHIISCEMHIQNVLRQKKNINGAVDAFNVAVSRPEHMYEIFRDGERIY